MSYKSSHSPDFEIIRTISNSKTIEWITIQGVIGRVISESVERAECGQFKLTSTITPELYDKKSYY